jgi:hypothetical protein
VLSKLLTRFIFGSYESGMSLVVHAMMCLENLYRHMGVMKRVTDSDDDGDSDDDKGSTDKNYMVEAILYRIRTCGKMSPLCSVTYAVLQARSFFEKDKISSKGFYVHRSRYSSRWQMDRGSVFDCGESAPVAAHGTRINSCSIFLKTLPMPLRRSPMLFVRIN